MTTRTAAIVPVHLYGHPAPMGRIVDVAAKHGLAVVEDAAQAHLAALDGRPVGTFGAGGRLQLLPHQEHDRGRGRDGRVRRRGRRTHGAPPAQPGHGTPLRQRDRRLQHADDRPARRHRSGPARRAARPDGAAQAQRRVPRQRRWRAPVLVVPPTAPGAAPVWHQYTVRAPDRDRLRSRLADRGVGTGVYYPTPIHRLPAYALDARPARDRAGRRRGALPPGPPGVVTRPSSTTSSRPSTWAVARVSRTLRAGIIGLGRMGRHHVRVLGEMPDVDLVAAVDTQHRLPRFVAGARRGRHGRGPPRPGHRHVRARHPHRDARTDRRCSWPRPVSPRSSRSRSPTTPKRPRTSSRPSPAPPP